MVRISGNLKALQRVDFHCVVNCEVKYRVRPPLESDAVRMLLRNLA